MPCQYSPSLSTAPRFNLQRQGVLGLPGNVGASSVTVPTSRDRRPRTTAVAASTPAQAHRRQPAASARQRFGSPCSFGHFDSCATQAPPCFPSCTSLRSRDTRTQGRGPARPGRDIRKSALATQQPVYCSSPRFVRSCLQRPHNGHGLPLPYASCHILPHNICLGLPSTLPDRVRPADLEMQNA